MKAAKLTTIFVLFMLCSSIFAFAQETDPYADEPVEECKLGCKIWQFLFGSKEARAGRAWFDRSDALVGEAGATPKAEDEKLLIDAGAKKQRDGTYLITVGADKTFFRFQNGKWQWASEKEKNANTWSDAGKNPWTVESAHPLAKVNELSSKLGGIPSDSAPTPAASTMTPEQQALNQKYVEAKEKGDLGVLTNLCTDYSKACVAAGNIHYKNGEYDKSLPLQQQACAAGDKTGCLNVGTHYAKGNGVQQDQKTALQFFNKGCALGDARACGNVQSVEDVFAEAGFAGKGPGSENYKAREEAYKKLIGKDDYKGAPEQNGLLLNALKEGTVTVPFKSGVKAGSQAETDRVKGILESSLGASYADLEKSVGKVKSVYERPGAGVYVISGLGGEVIVDQKADEDGVITAKRFESSTSNKIVERYVVVNGQIVATQKEAGGVVKVGESSYTLPKGKILTNADTLGELKEGIQLPGKEGEPSGILKLNDGVFTAINYEEETMQRINSKTKESTNLKGDYYRKGVSGCKTDGGCFVETGGEVTLNIDGKAQSYLVDYEYNKPFGADRTLQQKELFDPGTGRKNGIVLVDGKGETNAIITKSGKKTEQGEVIYQLQDAKTGTTIEAKKVGDDWRTVTSPTSPKLQDAKTKGETVAKNLADTQRKLEEAKTKEENLKSEYATAKLQGNKEEEAKVSQLLATAQAERNTLENKAGKLGEELSKINADITKEEQAAKEAEDKLTNTLNSKENKEALKELETEEVLATIDVAIQSIYSITNNFKSYPAISNLLFGEADFYKDWRSKWDKAFAPLLASNWFPSAICENNALHWQDIEPEGKAVIKTTSGTYQAVASIQMERSPEASPILCHKNPDEESDELFICDSRQVCVDDTFCYADQDRDNEPDSDEPLKGYFYKVTWAVSSPQDEAFTPLVDENGVAVSFNVFLYPGAVPMYNLNGNIASPIQLQNGASDRDAIIKYSTNVYDQACIRWNQAPVSINIAGRDGVAAGYGAIEDVCFNVVTSDIGKVNWERSGQSGASVSVSSGQVTKNSDW